MLNNVPDEQQAQLSAKTGQPVQPWVAPSIARFASTSPSSVRLGCRRTSNSISSTGQVLEEPDDDASMTNPLSSVQVSTEPFGPLTAGSTTGGKVMFDPLKLVEPGTYVRPELRRSSVTTMLEKSASSFSRNGFSITSRTVPTSHSSQKLTLMS